MKAKLNSENHTNESPDQKFFPTQHIPYFVICYFTSCINQTNQCATVISLVSFRKRLSRLCPAQWWNNPKWTPKRRSIICRHHLNTDEDGRIVRNFTLPARPTQNPVPAILVRFKCPNLCRLVFYAFIAQANAKMLRHRIGRLIRNDIQKKQTLSFDKSNYRVLKDTLRRS